MSKNRRLRNPPHANNNLLLLMIKYPLCSHLGIKSIPDLLLFSLVSGHYCAYLICCRKCSEACKQAEEGDGTESELLHNRRLVFDISCNDPRGLSCDLSLVTPAPTHICLSGSRRGRAVSSCLSDGDTCLFRPLVCKLGCFCLCKYLNASLVFPPD